MKEMTMSRVKGINTGMASASTDVVHHIGLVNKSLDLSAACYEKLGFTLTPVSIPRIVPEPGGVPETLGVANRHAVFAHNYLELLGIADPAWWGYEGLHIMHFGTDDIDAVKERLDYQGVMCSPVKLFQRNVPTENGERMMKARTISFPPDFNPEGLLQVAQHDTPELVFQQRYMHHGCPTAAAATA